MKKIKLFLILLFVIIIASIIFIILNNLGIFEKDDTDETSTKKPKTSDNLGKKDDWCYDPEKDDEDGFGLIKGFNSMPTDATSGLTNFAVKESVAAESTIGYSVGGAKDINNFRENIEKGYFPLETDITYEGIFYYYSFDTGNKNVKDNDKMFYPTYSTAISKDPISEKEEYYVSVGLNSNIDEKDFSRKKLNLVLVLDISGSMSSPINDYYYDFNDKEDDYKSKMRLAEESINVLIDELNPDDSIGIVLFDDGGYLAKPLNLVGETNIDALKEHILDIKSRGGTNFEAGINLANEEFDKYGIGDLSEYENRMIVITDAMPNIGETSKDGLRKILEDNSRKGIYTTFIGVGLDFNSEVVKNITDIRGANYYSVSSEDEFKTRMGDEFEFMVTPLVFDLNMDLESTGFEIEKIYGTDSLDSEKGNILHVNTLFPSKSNDSGEVKGGIILLKLKKIDENAKDLKLKVSYETRDGKKDSSSEVVKFSDSKEYYDNTGIRKGIVLSRYVNLIKNWTEYERTKNDRYLITPIIGIIDYYEEKTNDNNYYDDYYYGYYSENERVSVDLTVSEKYKEIFNKFREYMINEIKELDDKDLNQEVKILEIIMDAP